MGTAAPRLNPVIIVQILALARFFSIRNCFQGPTSQIRCKLCTFNEREVYCTPISIVRDMLVLEGLNMHRVQLKTKKMFSTFLNKTRTRDDFDETPQNSKLVDCRRNFVAQVGQVDLSGKKSTSEAKPNFLFHSTSAF